MADFTTHGNTVTFWLKIKPRSSRRRLLRNSSGEFCLELTAPPVKGHANEAAVDFLADLLRLPRLSVEIVAGAKSRRKLFRITSGSINETIARLESLVPPRGS